MGRVVGNLLLRLPRRPLDLLHVGRLVLGVLRVLRMLMLGRNLRIRGVWRGIMRLCRGLCRL